LGEAMEKPSQMINKRTRGKIKEAGGYGEKK
jgi:hypothetical protein